MLHTFKNYIQNLFFTRSLKNENQMLSVIIKDKKESINNLKVDESIRKATTSLLDERADLLIKNQILEKQLDFFESQYKLLKMDFESVLNALIALSQHNGAQAVTDDNLRQSAKKE